MGGPCNFSVSLSPLWTNFGFGLGWGKGVSPREKLFILCMEGRGLRVWGHVLKTASTNHQNIYLFKVILTSSSPYFYTMFLSDFGERDKSRVELKGLDVNSFEVIMKFIYTGQLEISTENAQSLIMVN